MIVKDEEVTLGRCLESVKDVADEIVIVDTGSKDKTKQIAKKFGAKVHNFDWIDDFSAARNYSFSFASKDYVMWLDADDILQPFERKKLLNLKKTLQPDIDAVSMLYNIEFDSAGNVITSTRRIRLVKRAKQFHWAGVVHEDLLCAEDFSCLLSDITVTHDKPTADQGPSDRNLKIFEKHIKAGHKMIPRDLFHYAYELKMNRKFKEAIPYHEDFLRTKEADTDLALFTLNNLASCYYMIGEEDKEWECTLRSLDYDVPHPEFSCRFAERFLNRKQYNQAIFWYQLAANYDSDSQKNSMIQNHIYRTWLPYKQLAYCYYELGDYKQSLHYNELAAQLLPDDKDIQSNISMLKERLAK